MKRTPRRSTSPLAARALLVLSVLGLVRAPGTLADDRDLFRTQSAAPYLFIMLDTSGSMNWNLTFPTDNSLYDVGYPAPWVPAGEEESELHGSGDDSRSRAYLAKAAIYEVVKQLPESVRVGFAQFGQGGREVHAKHWVYRIEYDTDSDGTVTAAERPPWYGTVPYPQQRQMLRFGTTANPQRGFVQSTYGIYPLDPTNNGYADRTLYQSGASWFWGNYQTPDPPDASDSYKWNRLNHFPKLGPIGATPTSLRFRHGGNVFQINWQALAVGQAYGKPTLTVQAQLQRRTGGAFTWPTFTFQMVPFQTGDQDGIPYTARDSSGNPYDAAGEVLSVGYATLNMPSVDRNFDVHAPCPNVGWEDNGYNFPGDNAASGGSGTYYYPTSNDPTLPARGNPYARGDMLPWDWKNHPVAGETNSGFTLSNRDEFLRRMAPNVALPNQPTFASLAVTPPPNYQANDVVPDFRIARYFEDQPSVSGLLPLRAEYANTPPLAFFNGTPITDTLVDFKAWYDAWYPAASDATSGDPSFQCRERYLVVLTDGVANCNENLATVLTGIRTANVRSFAVGFGPSVSYGQLQTMANAGGTGQGAYYAATDGDATTTQDCQMFRYVDQATGTVRDICPGPLTASTKQGLVAALLQLVEATNAAPTSFASAAVPTAQIEAPDSIFLTSFLPVDVAGTWPGTINHFVRPLPLKLGNNNKYFPDTTKVCNTPPSRTTGCFAWNAKDTLLTQAAPDTSTITAALGSGAAYSPSHHKVDYGLANGRRVLYSPEQLNQNVPMPWLGSGTPAMNLFVPLDPGPASTAQKEAFLQSLDYTYTAGTLNAQVAEANRMILHTLATKIAPDPLTEGATNISWLLGDVFHSDPVVVGPPNRFDYMRSNLNDNGAACKNGSADNPGALGYRCFFEHHRLRRKVLLVGTNDGQLHGFDAGTFERASSPKPTQPYGSFNSGTGKELFSVIPRALIPSVKLATNPGSKHDFRFDGTVRTDDVFIDTKHQGTGTVSLDDDRAWRTVAVAGLREGGRSYVALDVTHPDPLEVVSHGGVDQFVPAIDSNYVPDCAGSSIAPCRRQPYPMLLWEFEDLDNAGVPSDEDGNGKADLGRTWSTPNTGRIRVNEGGTAVDKYVATFGGGMEVSSEGDIDAEAGNWLYIVDIETGKAIYKRELVGAVPSEPAAVDSDLNGYLDTIYVGTTSGIVYKVDLQVVVDLEVDNARPGKRWIDDPKWEPFELFDTGNRPIYYPPSVVYVAKRNDYAVMFATGNREDIFDKDGVEGRFYALRDPGLMRDVSTNDPPSFLPWDEGDLEQNNLADVSGSTTAAGYSLDLDVNDRAIGKVFTIAGVTVFGTFVPGATGGNGNCEVDGVSRIYTLFTNSGDGLDPSEPYYEVEGFVSNPYTENSSTSKTTDGTPYDSELDTRMENILKTLKDQLPGECKFSNVTINLKTVRSDTGVEFIAPLPVCQLARNWKEF